ncbi:hypothetical protein ACFP81_00875 [Deinococcus lacus]|uniref:Uncharacterized protein n=1 Tax=Deinococcus lacus TaxID=392561 RepID=A0ABW1Y9C3_9DEIO
MLAYNSDLFVRIEEVEGDRAPVPKPLSSGFSPERAYHVLGVYNPSETSDAYFILCNDREELWFICQRHLRFAGLHSSAAAWMPLEVAQAQAATPGLPQPA